MFIEQPSIFLRWIYPSAMWRINPQKKSVYLTFDDGPIPEATPFVLDVLDRYGVKATFFMVGDNVRKYPEIHKMVVERGHCVGNHTFNHIGGFRHSSKEYLE
ncbi:MAG: polysaccharide deacetylase family protein, partial [Paraprevotella sp.]|nr:polysaccharide deacetylase family protein [Paraprevotella sp.]